MNKLEATNQHLVSLVETGLPTLSLQLQQLLSGNFTLQLTAPPPAVATATATATLAPLPRILPSPATESQYTSAHASPLNRSPSPPLQPEPQQPWEQEELPAYRMCRTIKTVEGLWREWTVGLPGKPSITALDSRWGSRWRAGRHSELQWYSLRFEVIKEIRRTAGTQRLSEEAAMWAVNLQQRQIGCSLDQFCKKLRAGRKARITL